MLSNLFDCLSLIEDPRLDRRKLHLLDFILLIVFTSTLSGCNSWYDIEDYAEHWEEDLKHLYKALTGKDILHGIPSHDSLNRAFTKGLAGDAVNLLLAAAAYNFKRAMRALLNLLKILSEMLSEKPSTDDFSLGNAF